MKQLRFIINVIFWTALMGPIVQAQKIDANDAYHPKIAQDDLVLPLPNGGKMVFRPIAVSTSKSAFSARQFKIGDRAEGGFQEYPTDVSVGGAVVIKNGDNQEWAYFLGKFEVTEAQWYSVMPGGTPELAKSALPVRNITWFEALDFINRYNLWLFENARQSMPKYRDRPTFLRLPTEIEWEFAARGGLRVSQNEFDRKTPYSMPLNKHEWFGGATSSHNKVKKIGRLEPNVLGLHDLLGNVAEMTCSNYSVEYYQGRVGGLVSRGGHFFSKESELRSSARDEQPLYTEELKPGRQTTLGFRLAIASQIFVDPLARQEMEAEWESHRQRRAVPALASAALPNTSAQAQNRVGSLRDMLGRLRTQLSGASPDAQNTVGLASALVGDVEAYGNQAERALAKANVLNASLAARIWGRTLQNLPKTKELIGLASTPEEEALYQRRFQEQQLDVKQCEERYGSAMRALGACRNEFVQEAFAEERKAWQELKVIASVRAVDAALRHYKSFCETQRTDVGAYTKDIASAFEVSSIP